MNLFLLYLFICFLSAYFLWDRKPGWRYWILSILALILCVGYLFFNKL